MGPIGQSPEEHLIILVQVVKASTTTDCMGTLSLPCPIRDDQFCNAVVWP